MSQMSGSRVTRVVVSHAITLMLGAGLLGVVAFAGGAGSSIQACVLQPAGLVRIVDDPASCLPVEESLSWPASSSPGKTIVTGGSYPDTMHCIPCNGQAAFLGPMGGHSQGLGVGNPGEAQVSVPMPAGRAISLRVKQTFSEGGTWSYNLWKNGAPTPISCSVSGAMSSCATTGSIDFAEGDTLSIGVGNPGAPFTTGGFRVKFSIDFELS